MIVMCAICLGDGIVLDAWDDYGKCSACDGTGWVEGSEADKLRVKAQSETEETA